MPRVAKAHSVIEEAAGLTVLLSKSPRQSSSRSCHRRASRRREPECARLWQRRRHSSVVSSVVGEVDREGGSHRRAACRSPSHPTSTTAMPGARSALRRARLKALIGLRSMLMPPWLRESSSAGLRAGWGSSDFEAASLQDRLEAALCADFAMAQWAALSCRLFSCIVGPGTLGIERAGVLAESIRELAMQGNQVLCSAWTTASRIGRLPLACVPGRTAPDSSRQYLCCRVFERALAQTVSP